MPSSASYRQSPSTAAGSTQTSREALTTQILTLVNGTDIPSTSDLTHLSKLLTDRNRQLEKRLSNLNDDSRDVFSGSITASEQAKQSLESKLDAEYQTASGGVKSRSPSVARRDRQTPSTSAAAASLTGKINKTRTGLHSSPPPLGSSTSGVAVTSPGGLDGGRTRVKVKREGERDREHSIEAGSIASGAGAGSPGLDADWDEDGPSRPGRTYLNKRKRHRANGQADSPGAEDTLMASDAETSTAHAAGEGAMASNRDSGDLSRRESFFSTSGSAANTSGFKLKLNPTAQPPLYRRDSLSSRLLRRQSGLRGGDISHLPLTPFQIQQAAMWELPKRTQETFVPKLAEPKPIRTYPTKPDQVDVDFASTDWRERDRERDRVEAATATGLSTGPGPGQAVVKESAMSRARDRKQEQVAFHTFQQWCDGWFRTLTEEDLAWLSSKSEDLEPFSIPSLGRHYKEVWDEEEANGSLTSTIYLPNAPYVTAPLTHPLGAGITPPTRLPQQAMNGASSSTHVNLSKTPKFDPRHLKDDHLFAGSLDDVRSGPFTERLLAALLPTPPPSEPDGSAPHSTNGHPAAGTGGLVLINGHGGGSAGVSQDMSDYEDRLMRELKAIDVLGNEEQVDWSDRTDDEVSSTLRKVQRLLRKQVRINELRKSRLFEVAMDRMAYQDYAACLTSVEREIEAGWMRRQTQIRKSMQAQKRKKGGSSSSSSNNANAAAGSGAAAVAAAAIGADGTAAAASAASPAAGTPGAGGTSMMPQASAQGFVPENRGGGPIKPQFTEALIGAMKKRQQLQYAFEPMFAERPLARFTPSADESIFRDLDVS